MQIITIPYQASNSITPNYAIRPGYPKYYLRADKIIVEHGIELGPVLKEYVAPPDSIFGSLKHAEQNENKQLDVEKYLRANNLALRLES